MEKMRARSVSDYGLLSLLGYLDAKQTNDELKQLLQRELWQILDPEDFTAHFAKQSPIEINGISLSEADQHLRDRQSQLMEQRQI